MIQIRVLAEPDGKWFELSDYRGAKLQKQTKREIIA